PDQCAGAFVQGLEVGRDRQHRDAFAPQLAYPVVTGVDLEAGVQDAPGSPRCCRSRPTSRP
ncbi:MAG: hypothetical protein AAF211_25750, partial [Myxococcota bacterium]